MAMPEKVPFTTPGSGKPGVVLAIDPGREKCGIAVVAETGEIVARDIVAVTDLARTVRRHIFDHSPVAVIVGNGTGSATVGRDLADCGVLVQSADERDTSRHARDRYLADHPLKGWKRLIPDSLRTPSVCYDDYVAILLAERWWSSREGSPES